MTFKSFYKQLMQRTGPAYGAGPAGFKRLMKRLGNPQNSAQIIHVAGTNGKGSVCYLTAQVLQQAGYKTGLFISPHLHSPTERIQINHSPISNRDFVRLCQKVLKVEIEKLNFFEILTSAAFLYFSEKKVQWVVLETGLGGRKDPTNVCCPSACVITSVGLDHCQILGNTLTQIAREKAGIIKPKVPVFCSPLPAIAMREIKQIARQNKATLKIVKRANPFTLKNIDWKKRQTILQKDKKRWKLNLLGEKQVQNACLVYQLCRLLGVSERAIKKGFESVQIPGRFEVIQQNKKTIILDGAHNPQAVENLMNFLHKSPWKGAYAVVCGFMADKDYPAMSHMMARHSAKLYLTASDTPRAATMKQLRCAVPCAIQTECFNLPANALHRALQEYSTVLVSGSFYVVSKLRAHLLRARGARRH